MRLIAVAAIVGALTVLAMPARAEPGPIGRWLMEEPYSLWDRGMEKASEATHRAIIELANDPGATLSGSAYYDWDDNEITLQASVHYWGGDLSHEDCNRMRRGLLRQMVGVPVSSEDFESEVYTIISYWFSHFGWQRVNRDEELAMKMARIMFVSFTFFRPGLLEGITCRARITETDAPSKPFNNG